MTIHRTYYTNPIGQPLPVGYLFAPNVLNLLLPVMWGNRANLEPVKLYGYPIGRGTMWEAVELAGQVQIAAMTVLEALRVQALECFVQNDNGGFDIVSRDIWAEMLDRHACELIESGEVFAFWCDNLKWADGCAILFSDENVADWLADFTSPHILPDPLKRLQDNLPDASEISLAQLATWLADEEVMGAESYRARLDSAVTTLIAGGKRISGHDDWSAQESADFEVFVATEAARDERMSSVIVEITRQISLGEIQAFGRSKDGADHLGELRETSANAFLDNLALYPVHDAIAADGSGKHNDYRAARRAEVAVVRFRRDNVVDVWGGEPVREHQPCPTLGECVSVTPRYSRAALEKAYIKRVSTWPDDQQPPSRQDDEAWGDAQFGCPRTPIRELRNEHAPH